MDEYLLENTKTAAYLLWEYSKCENTLALWNCAEDIASFLEQSAILTLTRISDILHLGKYELGYIHFVRHIAFRIYIYTGVDDSLKNWYNAESLLENSEWRRSIINMAMVYNKQKQNSTGSPALRFCKIKN